MADFDPAPARRVKAKMERMVNMVSHIKMQQFSFITIYINAVLYDLEIISLFYDQVLFLVIAGKDGRDGVNGDVHYFIKY